MKNGKGVWLCDGLIGLLALALAGLALRAAVGNLAYLRELPRILADSGPNLDWRLIAPPLLTALLQLVAGALGIWAFAVRSRPWRFIALGLIGLAFQIKGALQMWAEWLAGRLAPADSLAALLYANRAPSIGDVAQLLLFAALFALLLVYGLALLPRWTAAGGLCEAKHFPYARELAEGCRPAARAIVRGAKKLWQDALERRKMP